MQKQYVVELTTEERQQLEQLVKSGKAAARKLTHARILLKADSSPHNPGWTDVQVSNALEVHRTTVERVRKLFVLEGLEAALNRRYPKREYQRKIDGYKEAHLIALSCGAPPEGRTRWTLRLLADQMVELDLVESLSHETVRQVLKKRNKALAEEKMVHF